MPAKIPLTREEDSSYRQLRRLAFPEESRANGRRGMAKWRLLHPELSRERSRAYIREYRKQHPEKFRQYDKNRNREHRRRWANLRLAKRLKTDINFRIQKNLRSRIRMALCGSKTRKAFKTQTLIGCSPKDLIIYIESKFDVGMSWQNYGEWHIDHIIPCAAFDLTKPEHQRACFHFSNMQPLWAATNVKKGDKIITNQFNLL